MNERIEAISNPVIRKLAEDAQRKHTGDFGMTIYGGVDLEKFAELIINECANAVLSIPLYYKDHRSQIEEAVINDCARVVQEHFGVEQ